MSRKRTLYLSELLTRCRNKVYFKVSLKTKNTYTHYNNVKSTILLIKETELWNFEVYTWYIDTLRNYLVIETK